MGGRMEAWLLDKRLKKIEDRLDAGDRAFAGLFELRTAVKNMAEINGMRVEACELRSRLALALAEGSPDVPEHRRRWEEFKARAVAKYPGLDP